MIFGSNVKYWKFILLIRRTHSINFYKQSKFQINYAEPIQNTCSVPGTNSKINYLTKSSNFSKFPQFQVKYIESIKSTCFTPAD